MIIVSTIISGCIVALFANWLRKQNKKIIGD
ncbi:type I toxin-antitoxin system Fst family toxin [Mammaliicoccus sciuri]|uniref:Type I toxin-antitoxin system Fst family toxin n=2 Tax=Mammaliicoccus sciuri TaxID=1296 RepID=A0AB37HRS3_MAMSC|nr:type I toxin-antitoxin system Fst family toxin [Mammaliicoccus sciuri]MEB6343222.1 type I toxin-antitoxin system Fst family toxin [Mammaliicoccus sciuri]MEB7415040.1 type I toxin-antitoxin system Fst family toxin [Mammaliicoccus sciuri]QRN92694.1 type I toxin-antitoxin system Fst family toxin [Mammaliicoccus sciuri]